MRTYIKPQTETIELQGRILLSEVSAIDPDNSGGNIFSGDGNSTDHPLDAKWNNSAWDGWDSDSE